MKRATSFASVAIVVATGIFGQTPSRTMLAHDRHDGLTVSADPYTKPARAKERFGKANPLEAGILPVEVDFRNETAQPIRIGLDTIRLEVRMAGGQHQNLESLSPDAVAIEIARPGGSPTPEARRPVGIPVPIKDKKAEKLAETLRPLALNGDVVPPMGTLHGFLFFDLNRDMSLATNASLYVPNVFLEPGNKALMFFEIPLGAQ